MIDKSWDKIYTSGKQHSQWPWSYLVSLVNKYFNVSTKKSKT